MTPFQVLVLNGLWVIMKAVTITNLYKPSAQWAKQAREYLGDPNALPEDRPDPPPTIPEQMITSLSFVNRAPEVTIALAAVEKAHGGEGT